MRIMFFFFLLFFRNMKIDFDMPCYTRRYERKGHEPL